MDAKTLRSKHTQQDSALDRSSDVAHPPGGLFSDLVDGLTLRVADAHYSDPIEQHARDLIDAGLYAAAIEAYSTVIERQATAAALLNRGWCHEKLRKHSIAIDDYTRALSLPSTIRPAILVNRGAAYRTTRQYQSALADYDRAIALDRKLAAAHFNRAIVLIKMRRKADAILAFKTFLECADPDNPQTQNLLMIAEARRDIVWLQTPWWQRLMPIIFVLILVTLVGIALQRCHSSSHQKATTKLPRPGEHDALGMLVHPPTQHRLCLQIRRNNRGGSHNHAS